VSAADTPAGERLDTYRAKREFSKTPEPRGAEGDGATPSGDGDGDAPRFVVQRHRARRLHYDFRIEDDGVLVSWAVPKGLTLDPSERHLAVHVEDHPLEYFDFEGVIPPGEYGGGDVIVWDQGTYELHVHDNAREAVESGEVHLELHGQKLRGRFVLVRTRSDSRGKEQWLALHKKDEHSQDGWDPEEHPRSVLSGRTNDEVAAAPEREWTRDGERVLVEPARTFAGPTSDELAALDAIGKEGEWEIGGRVVRLTNLDKVLFAARGDAQPATKRDLVRYYTTIAPTILPYLVDRPLNLHRFPDGVQRKGFWQKQAPKYAPDWFPRWENADADEGESREYLVPDSVGALAWLANHAAVELHAWTSRAASPNDPTYALVDIDPGDSTTWDDVVTLARLHRTALEHLGVRGFPKTSGRRGLQVWIPIAAGPTFEETRHWVEQLSHVVGQVVPELVSWTWGKRERGGLARLDYTQNAINKTLVAPYSVRAADGAPVSMPIDWDELDDPELRSDRFSIRDAPDRVADVGDLMAEALRLRQTLPPIGS
jgi:bifunctional non-homologous end joining protein LigD